MLGVLIQHTILVLTDFTPNHICKQSTKITFYDLIFFVSALWFRLFSEVFGGKISLAINKKYLFIRLENKSMSSRENFKGLKIEYTR